MSNSLGQSKKYIFFGFFPDFGKKSRTFSCFGRVGFIKNLGFSKKKNLIKFLEFEGKQPYAEHILQKSRSL